MKKLLLLTLFLALVTLGLTQKAQAQAVNPNGFTNICGMGKYFKPPLSTFTDARFPSWWTIYDRTPCDIRQTINLPSVKLEGYCSPFPNRTTPVSPGAPSCTAGPNERVHAYVCNTGTTVGEGCMGGNGYSITNIPSGTKYSLGNLQSSQGSNYKCGQTVQFDIFNKTCTQSMIDQHYRNVAGISNPSGDANGDGVQDHFESRYFVNDASGVPTFCLAKDAFVWYTGTCSTGNPVCTVTGATDNLPVGTPRSYTGASSDPDGGTIKSTQLYYSSTSSESWQQLASSQNSNSATGNFTCPGVGTYYVSCNATDDENTFCSGNPFDDKYLDCGPNDTQTVTCVPQLPKCTGVPITTVRTCLASGGYLATLNWVRPAGATNFTVAYRTVGGTWNYADSIGNVTTWTGTFPDNLAREFMVRIRQSTACDATANVYGAAATVTNCLPTCGGVTTTNALACTATGTVQTCSWTKPVGATEMAVGYKATSSTNWVYATSVTNPGMFNTDKTNWKGYWNDNISRDCRVRVYRSTTCTPGDSAYGPVATSGPVTCNAPTVTIKNELVTTNASTGTSPFRPGNVLTFRATVTNTGSSVLNNVIISDPVPTYTTFSPTVSNTLNGTKGAWSFGNGKYNFTAGTLAVGQAYSVYYAVSVNNYITPGTYASSNTACVNASSVINGPCSTVPFDLFDIVNTSALTVSQLIVYDEGFTVGSLPFSPGNKIVFRITARNTGNTTLTNVVLQDTIPPHTTLDPELTSTLNGVSRDAWSCDKVFENGVCTTNAGTLTPDAGYFSYFAVTVNNYTDNVPDISSVNNACAQSATAPKVCSSLPFDLKELVPVPVTPVGGVILNVTDDSCVESATNPKLKQTDVKDGIAKLKIKNGANAPVIKTYDFGLNRFSFNESLLQTEVTKVCADTLEPAASLGEGVFVLTCAKLNGGSENFVQSGTVCTKDLTSGLNFGTANNLTLGFKFVPSLSKPWFQSIGGDVYSGDRSPTGSGSILQTIQTTADHMIKKIGSAFGNKGVNVKNKDGDTRYSEKGATIKSFIRGTEVTWPNDLVFTVPNGKSLNSTNCSLSNEVYRTKFDNFNSWLSNCSSYTVSDEGLAVIYVYGGVVEFSNNSGLKSTNDGKLIVVVNNKVGFHDEFGKNSGARADLGLIAKQGIEFLDDGTTGLTTLKIKGFLATKGDNDIKFLRSLGNTNATLPAVTVEFDPAYIIKLTQMELKNMSQAPGLTKFDIIWEVYD